MTDVVDPETRSRMMSGIRGKDTKPELAIRKALWSKGYRYRLHDKRLPGKPDIVLRKYRTVIFVHGCFWHGHDCALFKWPGTRSDFWKKKISRNREKDAQSESELLRSGWKVITVWECALKGRERIPLDVILTRILAGIGGKARSLTIRGEQGESG